MPTATPPPSNKTESASPSGCDGSEDKGVIHCALFIGGAVVLLYFGLDGIQFRPFAVPWHDLFGALAPAAILLAMGFTRSWAWLMYLVMILAVLVLGIAAFERMSG